MTSANPARYPELTPLRKLLRSARSQFLLRRAGEVLAGQTSAVLLAGLVLGGLGMIPGQLPPWLRWGLFAVLLGGAAAMLWTLLRTLLNRPGEEQLARLIETRLGDRYNSLINPLLMAQQENPASPALARKAVAEAVAQAGQLDLARAVESPRLRSRSLLAMGLAAAVVLFAMLAPQPMLRGLIAATMPGRFMPAHNAYPLVELTPGDADLFPGQSVRLRLAVRADEADALRARVELTPGGTTLPLARTASDVPGVACFTASLPPAHETTGYVVHVSGSAGQSRFPAERRAYLLRVGEVRPERLALQVTPPPYTGQAARQIAVESFQAGRTFDIADGSEITVRLTVSAPLGRVKIAWQQSPAEYLQPTGRGETFTHRLTLDRSRAFAMSLLGPGGEPLGQVPTQPGQAYRLEVRPDEPPSVAILRPGRDASIAPGEVVELLIEARDDIGLSRVTLWAGTSAEQARPVETVSLPDPAGAPQFRRPIRWTPQAPLGSEVVYFATATDTRQLPHRGGPQTSRSRPFTLSIRPAEQRDQARTDLLARLEAKLHELLDLQVRLRGQLNRASHPDTPLDVTRRQGQAIFAGQRSIHRQLASLAEHFPFTAEMMPLADGIGRLASGDAPLAAEQAEVIARMQALAERPVACRSLAGTQDRIINDLQTMLSLLPTLAPRPATQQATESSEDATARKQRRENLTAKLKELIKDQTRAIDATSHLAKIPLDELSPDDHKTLEDLRAMQDQWEKFLAEQFTDFSKLAEQDFANPALLKELLSVKAEITMARDALHKKALEIATAAESNGLENAVTLTANIEKWLPDKPDRIQWVMEAPLEQLEIEQAELPSELEDLVGDLLEEEEDLFEEMNDLSSLATMSGDKGIGWDAMDGPISNMNAQGVTGNQLPNTNELQGRSGEGRTGKSSGEYVEDKAVGKGGRRTPTRLTGDSYQKGRIDDTSTESPGGATGGGKVSGAGREGLEGPTPKELSEAMQALAGRQAELINRAERVQATFVASDYSSFRMQQAILLMNRIRGDLQAGRYTNALRKRDEMLGALRQMRSAVGPAVRVERDASAALPKGLRESIDEARGGKLPAEYRETLEEYYRRLGQQAPAGR